MKKLILYVFFISSLGNCKPEEDNNTPTYTFKAQLINASTNEVPVGLKVTLEASKYPDGLSDFKTEILGTSITDSFGRFSITYKRTKLPILTLLSQFLTYKDLPINTNVDTVLYRSSKGTLVYKLIADNPLTLVDTIIVTLPPKDDKSGFENYIITGPLLNIEFRSFKVMKTTNITGIWGLGKVNFNDVDYHREKHKNQIFIFNMRGDPLIDTIKIKYR